MKKNEHGSENSSKILWIASLATSFLLLSSIIFIIVRYSNLYNPYSDFVTVREKVPQFLNNYLNEITKNGQSYNLIPTGIYIQSFRFIDPDTVFMSGYIWQKFPTHMAPTKPNFILPEAVDFKTTDAYQSVDGNILTQGWYFEGKIIKNFIYDKYPMDIKRIWVRIWPANGNSNTILVPDFSSYSRNAKDTIFGLDSQIVLRDFTLQETFFDYKLIRYETNFGLKYSPQDSKSLELYFNIIAKRKILSAFITKLLPLMIVLGFTFALLFMITFDDERKLTSGFTLQGVIAACSALLFVVLLSHIQLRNNIVEGGIIYLEYIYFTIYIALFYVVVNAFLVITLKVQKSENKFFNYKDNILPKLIFWPFILFLILISTYYKF